MSRQIGVMIHQRKGSIPVILKESGSTLLAGSACVHLPILFNQPENLSPASIVLVSVQLSVTKIFSQALYRINLAFTKDLVCRLLTHLLTRWHSAMKPVRHAGHLW